MRTIIDKLPGERLTVHEVVAAGHRDTSKCGGYAKEYLAQQLARKISNLAAFNTYGESRMVYPVIGIELDVIVIKPDQLRAELMAMYQKGASEAFGKFGL